MECQREWSLFFHSISIYQTFTRCWTRSILACTRSLLLWSLNSSGHEGMLPLAGENRECKESRSGRKASEQRKEGSCRRERSLRGGPEVGKQEMFKRTRSGHRARAVQGQVMPGWKPCWSPVPQSWSGQDFTRSPHLGKKPQGIFL